MRSAKKGAFVDGHLQDKIEKALKAAMAAIRDRQ